MCALPILIGGGLGLVYGLPIAGPLYDAILHIFFVGFVFSMIFAHAAVIIPSLTGKMVPYSNYFYLPLILLHLFLFVRVLRSEERRVGKVSRSKAVPA